MSYSKKIKNLFAQSNVTVNEKVNDRIINDSLKEISESQNSEQFQGESVKWRITMKNTGSKLAIAAAAIFAFAMFTMLYLNSSNNQQIKIPAELVAMSAEELIKLNINSQDSTYSSEVIEAALKQALDKLPPLEVIELAKKFSDENPIKGLQDEVMAVLAMIDGIGGIVAGGENIVTANISDYNWIPMIEFLEAKDKYIVRETPDMFVNARLLDININVDDIKQALIERRTKKFFIEDMVPDDRYRTTIQLEVLDITPKDTIEKGKIINVPTLLSKEILEKFNIGSQYYIAMLQGKNGPEFYQYMKGIFEINSADDSDLFPMRFWTFLCDTQDIIRFGNTPKKDAIDYWTSLLNSEACNMAIAYMRVLPDEFVPYEVVRDTIVERFLNEENFLLSFKHLDMLPDELIPAQSIVDILELKYNNLKPMTEQIKDDMTLAERMGIMNEIRSQLPDISKVVNLLIRSNDKESIKKLYSIFVQDAELGDNKILLGGPLYNLRSLEKTDLAFQIFIAVEEDGLVDNFEEIFHMYESNVLLSEIFENQAEYINALLSVIHDKAGDSLDENFYAMLLELSTQPSANGIENADSLKILWKEIISGGYYDMRPYLEEFVKNSNLSDIGVELTSEQAAKPDYAKYSYEQAAFEMLRELPAEEQPTRKELINMLVMICDRYNNIEFYSGLVYNTCRDILQQDDTELIPILTKLIIANKPSPSIKSIVAEKMPDPAFIPVAKNLLEKKYDRDSAILLFACGEKENAISIVIQNDKNIYPLNKLFDQLFKSGEQEKAIQIALENNKLSSSLLELYYESGKQDRAIEIGISLLEQPAYDLKLFTTIIQLFAKSDRKDLVSLVERYTNEEVLTKLSEEIESSSDRPRFSFGSVSELKENAIMALAKLGGEDAIPRLRQIYKTDEDIYMRHIAAISLYYLGDDIGWEILEPLIDGTFKENSQLAPLLDIEFSMRSILQNPITRGMLGNDKTYSLLIEKMRNYIDNEDDVALFIDIYNRPETTQFFDEHKEQILPIILHYLNDSSEATRSIAIGYLRKITGQDFGFQTEKKDGQEQIIQQWKNYIESEY